MCYGTEGSFTFRRRNYFNADKRLKYKFNDNSKKLAKIARNFCLIRDLTIPSMAQL